jgi:hypothetical protein
LLGRGIKKENCSWSAAIRRAGGSRVSAWSMLPRSSGWQTLEEAR